MSAFDKLQNYSAKQGYHSDSEQYNNVENSDDDLFDKVDKELFDKTTPTGYFLRAIHKNGYKVIEMAYFDKEGNKINEAKYNSLSDSEKENYVGELIKSELCEALTTSGDQLIISSAGSGKTTALIFKIMLDIANGEATKLVQVPNGSTVRVVDSIFVGTFLKSGAEELKTRLAEEQRRYGYVVTANNISFGTLHAEFYRALIAMNVPIKIGDSKVLAGFLHECYKSFGVCRSGGAPLTSEDFQVLDSIITYCRGRLDEKRYNHPSCSDYENMTPTFIDRIIASYNMKKVAAGISDFEDLQDLLYKYLYVTPNPAVQEFIANRYNYIYLDEFQDTSQIQYAILKFYARGRLKCNKLSIQSEDLPQGYYTGVETTGKIVAIGDPDQTIYTWRGSDVNIISRDFDSDFIPSISVLSRNYRCPENILAPITKSITINPRAYDFPIQAARVGGEFNAYHFTSVQNMLNQLSKDIDKDMSEGNSVAILCRTNFDGVIPAFMLEMEHKYQFSISSDLMTLSSPLPRKILSVTSLFTERTTKGVQNALELFVFRGLAWKIRELIQTLKNDDSQGNKVSIWTLNERDIEYSCPEILPIVQAIKKIILNPDGTRNRQKEIDGLKFVYKYLKVNTYGGDSAYCESARAYIDAMLYLLDSKDFDSVFDFQEEVNTYNDRLKARINKKKALISIVTVHEFKGKERDSTYVWNDSDNVYPPSKTNIEDESQVEEERRVHYIACTRAKKRNSIYSIKGKEGLFLKEMGVDLVDPIPITGALRKSVSIDGLSPSDLLKEEEDNLAKALEGIKFSDEIPADCL